MKNGFVLLLLFKLKSQRTYLCKPEQKQQKISCFLLGHFEGMRLLVPFTGLTAQQSFQPCLYLSPSCLLKNPQGQKAATSHPTYSIAPVVHRNCLSIACLLQGASSHPVLRHWTNSSWLHSTPKAFSPGEIFQQRLLGKF